MTAEQRKVDDARLEVLARLEVKCPRCLQNFECSGEGFTGCQDLACSRAGCGCHFCGWCQTGTPFKFDWVFDRIFHEICLQIAELMHTPAAMRSALVEARCGPGTSSQSSAHGRLRPSQQYLRVWTQLYALLLLPRALRPSGEQVWI